MKFKITPLQAIVHLGAWYPLLNLVFEYYTGRLSINPYQEIEQHTGLAAIGRTHRADVDSPQQLGQARLAAAAVTPDLGHDHGIAA